MGSPFLKYAFSAGELAPSFWGRLDTPEWQGGASVMRNMFVNIRGGSTSRAGLKYVGKCKQSGSASPPRNIPFRVSFFQNYVLEFGDLYMRPIFDGGYVLENTFAITGATKANPCVISAAGHNFANNDWVFIDAVGGMTELNDRTFIVANVVAGVSFSLKDVFGNAINSTAFTTYTSGGTAARLYTLTTPYAAVDLDYLKYTQSADVMSLCLVNQETGTEYEQRDLTRNSPIDWVIAPPAVASSITAPISCTATPSVTTTTSKAAYGYVVTCVDANGEESVASPVGSCTNSVNIASTFGAITITWPAVAAAVSYNIYKATPDFTNNGNFAGQLFGYAGTTQATFWIDTNVIQDFNTVPPKHLNPFARGQVLAINMSAVGSSYTAASATVSITTSTGSGFRGTAIVGPSISGQRITFGSNPFSIGNTLTETLGDGSVATGRVIATTGTTADVSLVGATKFSLTGPIGFVPHVSNGATTVTATGLADITISGTNGIVGVVVDNPGAGYVSTDAVVFGGAGTGAAGTIQVGPETGTYPSVPAYFQQRRAYGGSLNLPDTYEMSQPGSYTNFDASNPPIDSDAITGNPWAQQVNGIQWMIPMPGGLVVMTGYGAWLVTGAGGGGTSITPSSQGATPQEAYGVSATVPPIRIGYDILYVQALGNIIRDLEYNYWNNIYAGTDISVYSNHLFIGYDVLQWAWAPTPLTVCWAVRSDGRMLSLTYLRDQYRRTEPKITGWARHDTQGLFKSVAAIPESPVDVPYFVVRRYITGQAQWAYYQERMDDRQWGDDVERCWCVDAGLSLPQATPDATLTPSGVSGTITFLADAGVFSAGNVGSDIRIGGGRARVTVYTDTTHVTALVAVPITNTIPDTTMPVPAESGEWTITAPVTVVTGLEHLEGMSVTGLANGMAIPLTTVANGRITLATAASQVVVGLPFTAQLQTMHIEVGKGTVQGQAKQVNSVVVRVKSSLGFQIGQDQPIASAQPGQADYAWANLQAPKNRAQPVATVATPLYTGDRYVSIDGTWNLESTTPNDQVPDLSEAARAYGMVAIQQTQPFPLEIACVVPEVNIGDQAG